GEGGWSSAASPGEPPWGASLSFFNLGAREASVGRTSISRIRCSTSWRRATAALSPRTCQAMTSCCISLLNFAQAAILPFGGTGIFRPRQKHDLLQSGQGTVLRGYVGLRTTWRQSKHAQVALLIDPSPCG